MPTGRQSCGTMQMMAATQAASWLCAATMPCEHRWRPPHFAGGAYPAHRWGDWKPIPVAAVHREPGIPSRHRLMWGTRRRPPPPPQLAEPTLALAQWCAVLAPSGFVLFRFQIKRGRPHPHPVAPSHPVTQPSPRQPAAASGGNRPRLFFVAPKNRGAHAGVHYSRVVWTGLGVVFH